MPVRLAAEEIVRLRSLIKRIDRALTDGKVETPAGEARMSGSSWRDDSTQVPR